MKAVAAERANLRREARESVSQDGERRAEAGAPSASIGEVHVAQLDVGCTPDGDSLT